MTGPNKDEWLTIADAAREIGLHPETVAKHIRDGLMPGIRLGKEVRIPRVQWTAFKAGTWQPPRSVRPVDLVARRTG